MTNLGDFLSAANQKKLGVSDPVSTSAIQLIDNTFPVNMVTTPEVLQQACKILAVHKELAFDLEFDDMRYFYGRTLALVQVFDGETVFIIDAVALPDLTPLLHIFEDENLVKIFHSCGNDLMVLSELYGCKVKNIQDTSVLYRLLGTSENSISLKNLIKEYLDIDLEKGEQSSNWITRPLTVSQIDYAAKDVVYLHKVKFTLQQQLQELNRWEWALEEGKALEKIQYKPDPQPHLKLAMKNRIFWNQMPRFAGVWGFREEMAKKLNKPPFQLFPNDILCELVRNPERTLEKWDTYRGIHPTFRKPENIEKLANLTSGEIPAAKVSFRENEARIKAFELSQRDYKAYLRNERKHLLSQIRKFATEELGLPITNLFLSERIMVEIADYGTEKQLKNWQNNLVMQLCENNGLDFSLINFSLYNLPV